MLQLFRYPPSSAPALLAGTLASSGIVQLRFAGKSPLLGACQYLDMLLAWLLQEGSVSDVAEVGCEEVSWVSGSRLGQEENSTAQKKNPAHLAGTFGSSISATCVEEVASCRSFCGFSC